VTRAAITRLDLTDFRSYTVRSFAVTAGAVVLIGPNGVGKTNALEALSLFAPGRGLRGATLADMARQGSAGPWAVSIELQRGDDVMRLGTGVTAESPNRRSLRVDGAPGAIADLPQWLSLLWLTPAMDRLFLDGASERRRFFDRLVLALYPDHAGHVARYEHAQRERLRLLTDARAADPVWLDGLERRIAEHGVAAAAARRDTAAALQPVLADLPIAPFPRAALSLECALVTALASQPALQVEDALRAELAEQRNADARTGRTGVGPHKLDMLVIHAPKAQPARLCSTGEQKALLISMVLAQAALVRTRSGQSPLLLLDEIAAHLDAERRAALFAILERLDVQAWMTGTDASLFSALEANASVLTLDPRGG
jgi:DNA replication and repair protein RecF